MIDIDNLLERPEIMVLMEILRLANSEAFEHSIRVAEMSALMLPHSKIPENLHEDIVIGALLHDIGKAFVPLNLTLLPQSLTNNEYNIIKVHSAVSYEIVKCIFSKTVQDICLYHHEKLNGTGYLSQKKLVDLPEEVLLVQVADVYDALTCKRIYKKNYSKETAIKMIEKDSRDFLLDDEYVEILKKVISSEV